MNFYDILLARCLCCNSGEESGGGGSSDLSTASVTLDVTGTPEAANFFIIEQGHIMDKSSNLGGTYNCILVYGQAEVTFTTKEPITTYSGDVQIGESEEYDGQYYTTVIITGDCSITLVGNPLN